MSAQKGTAWRKGRLVVPETGPFVLQSLLEDVPLSAEGDNEDIEINCVEFLGEKASCMATASLPEPLFHPLICPAADIR